jgi:hypothetical protein
MAPVCMSGYGKWWWEELELVRVLVTESVPEHRSRYELIRET